MYFAILRLIVPLTFIWNISAGTQEFLEYYQPRPDFPKELNEWLAYVQGHRNDFRIIRNIVKRRKAESDYYDERESEENKLLSDLEGEDEIPQNDIYPRDNLEKLDKTAVSTAKSRTNKAKRKLIKPARTRRESDENSFFEHTNTINVDPKGKVGEIKRSEPKYPDQFVNRPKDDDKRDIEIHILNDGKLLKSLKDEKSVVLNIENNEDNNPTAAATNDNVDDSRVKVVNSPERSVSTDKEAASNFRNLFTANENLNTDSSVAREALGKTALLYHVTLPSPNFMAPQETYNTSTLENHFQHNNFRDMSRYWSDVEKNQLQQGIDFAQEAGNLRKQNQKNTNDGFETARTIIIEHVANNPSSNTQKEGRFDMKRNLNNIHPTPAAQKQLEQPFEELDYTMKSNIDDVEVVHNNVKKNNHIIIITEKDTNEPDKLSEQRAVPSSPNKIEENINNLISITIVVPRKDEEPKEETKNYDTSRKLVDSGKIERTTIEQNIDQKSIQFDLNPETTTEEAHKTQFSGQLCEAGQCYNDRQLRLQKFRQREEDRGYYGSQEEKPFPLLQKEQVVVPYEVNNPRYLSRQSSSDFVKFPFNADTVCEGPNCFKNKSCQGPNCKAGTAKYKRKRGKRRHKNRREFDHSDYVQTYKLRQLKEVNYVYDADLEAPNLETVSSERPKRLGINKNVRVEGDYGDEEDSVSVRSNVTTKLIKKVDDVFANPHTTCEPDNEDYYYDEIDDKNKNSNINNHDSNVDTVSIGKRLHKKTKNPSKDNQNKGEPEIIQSQIREPRDLDQLPKFVINDEINEENLRKRSLANQKESQQNKFPLSSKSFFASNNVKRRDSGDSDLVNDKSSAPPAPDKSVTIDAMAAGASVVADKDAAAIGDALGQTELSVSAVTDECQTSTHVSVGPVCETDNFTKVKVTTMLNLAAAGENQGDLNNSLPSLSEQYQNLEDILVGRLPLSIVDSVFKHMKMHPTFKQRFFRGMKKKNLPVSFKNLPEISSKESNKLIRLMSKIINRLQWTTTCQTLPNKLKRYLKTITSTKVDDRLTKTKTMEEIDQAENQNQTNFIFHSSTGVDNIEEKVRILKNMLIKYQHLPENCKPRAEPVKEYIENHLDMLTHAMSSNMDPSHRDDAVGVKDSSSDVSHHEASKRNEKGDDSDLIEHELESLGLGKHPNFRPNFDLESLLKNSDKASEQGSQEGKIAAKKTNKRAAIRETSEEYDKLLEAVKRERIKREGKKRIAQAFGKLSIDDYKGTNTENIIDEIFENPLVYSF